VKPATNNGVLGAQHPVMLAGMGGIAGPRLVAAVADAGGIGTLGLYKAPPTRIAALIREVRSMTSGVFGVNFVPEVLEDSTLGANLEAAIAASDPTVFISFFGLPPSGVANQVTGSGRQLVVQVGTAADARQAIDIGVDVLIVQGTEAGGHLLGTQPTAELLRDVRSLAPGVPVLAAGGISCAADFDRLVQDGPADGVCCGTVFVATAESNAHGTYKDRIVQSAADDTVITEMFEVGWPGRRHRVVNTAQVRDGKIAAASVIARTRIYGSESLIFRYSAAVPTSETVGAIDDMALYCGVSCQSIHEPNARAGDVVRSLIGLRH
jgi:nitronate monooxygenase